MDFHYPNSRKSVLHDCKNPDPYTIIFTDDELFEPWINRSLVRSLVNTFTKSKSNDNASYDSCVPCKRLIYDYKNKCNRKFNNIINWLTNKQDLTEINLHFNRDYPYDKTFFVNAQPLINAISKYCPNLETLVIEGNNDVYFNPGVILRTCSRLTKFEWHRGPFTHESLFPNEELVRSGASNLQEIFLWLVNVIDNPPTERVVVIDLSHELKSLADSIAKSTHLKKVTVVYEALHIGNNYSSYTDPNAESLLEFTNTILHNQSLHTVNIQYMHSGNYECKEYMDEINGKIKPLIRQLNICTSPEMCLLSSGYNSGEISRLFTSPHLQTLKIWEDINDNEAAGFLKSNQTLQKLELAHVFKGEAWKAFVDGLKENHCLKNLKLGFLIGFKDIDFQLFETALPSPSAITELAFTNVNALHLKSITKALSLNHSVQNLKFKCMSLSDNILEPLANMLRGRKYELVKIQIETSLSLNLSKYPLHELLSSLSDSEITSLCIENKSGHVDHFSEEVGTAIGYLIATNRHMQYFIFAGPYSCKDMCKQAAIGLLQNSTLKCLMLPYDDDANDIYHALETNSSLQHLIFTIDKSDKHINLSVLDRIMKAGINYSLSLVSFVYHKNTPVKHYMNQQMYENYMRFNSN